MNSRSRAAVAAMIAGALSLGFLPYTPVQIRNASDPQILAGGITRALALMQVGGPPLVKLAGWDKTGKFIFEATGYAWETDVPVPFSLTWDRDLARLNVGPEVALEFDPQQALNFETVVILAESLDPENPQAAGDSISVRKVVLNMSHGGIGGPLRNSAKADSQRPEDLLLLRGVDVRSGFELSGEIVAHFGATSPRKLRVQIQLTNLSATCPAWGDGDCDGVVDFEDNCPVDANPDQRDGDFDPETELPAPDGVGDVCDNCPDRPNPDQLDLDNDGVGEACDNCPKDCSARSGFRCFNPDQTESDVDPSTGEPLPDGFGDACDNCFAVFNPSQTRTLDPVLGDACVQTFGAWRPEGAVIGQAEPGLGTRILRAILAPFSVASATAQASGGSFNLEFFCGGNDVSAANLSVNLPDGVTSADFAGCGPLLAGPERRRNCDQSALDPALIDRSQTYTLGPEMASPGGIDSGVMVIHLEGARSVGLAEPVICRAGDPPVAIGTLTLSPLASNAVPTLGNDWFELFQPPLQSLFDGNGNPIAASNLVVESGPPLPRVELRASPDVSDVSGFRNYALTIEAEFDLVSKLAVGISTGIEGILPTQLRVGGCDGPIVRAGGVDLVTCPGNPQALGPGVAPSSGAPPGTYLVRPNDPTLPPGTRPNTAYFVMVGNFPSAFDDSINYVSQRNKVALIEYLLPASAPAAPLPGVTFEGAAELVAAVEGVPLSSAEVIRHADEFETLAPTEVLLAGGFDAGEDLDGDGHPDDADNCVNAPNVGQLDSGGVLVANQSDGIGNVCQCGDGQLANDGTVFPDDVPACQAALTGAQTDAQTVERCSVTGSSELDIEDLVILQQRTAGNANAAIEQVCQPAVGGEL